MEDGFSAAEGVGESPFVLNPRDAVVVQREPDGAWFVERAQCVFQLLVFVFHDGIVAQQGDDRRR